MLKSTCRSRKRDKPQPECAQSRDLADGNQVQTDLTSPEIGGVKGQFESSYVTPSLPGDSFGDSILFDLSGILDTNDASTPVVATKCQRRSQKSPYLLRSPVIDSNAARESQTPLTLTSSLRKRLKNNSSRKRVRNLHESPVINEGKSSQQSEDTASDVSAPSQNGETRRRPYSIGFFGLPLKVKSMYEEVRGISKLFDWQKECLELESLAQRENLIYSLPTSGGKTLVAEILALKEVILCEKDVLFLFPFVSIVQEKLKGLISFANEFNFVLDEYAGSKGCIPPKKRRKNSIFFATIEKGNILVNSLIEAGNLDRIGLVIVDELHMIGEPSSRGAVLEVLLCKLMFVESSIHVVGMSATLNNINQVADFLRARVYSNDFRPVQLKQMVKHQDAIFTVNKSKNEESLFQFERNVNFSYTKEQQFKDPDHIVGLCSEIVPQDSCLVFCASKKNCENVATLICSFMPPALKTVKKESRDALLAELENDAEGHLCQVLKTCIPFGVAYHHSGLTMDERKAIEEAFLQGTLCLLCCTSTLAAGVNLPAKRVIIRSPYVGRDFISQTQYKQMTGRAGRTGFASEGESILIVNKSSDRCKIEALVENKRDCCKSSLPLDNFRGLKQVIISLVGLKICKSVQDLQYFLNMTLAVKQGSKNEIALHLTRVLQETMDAGLIKVLVTDKDDENGLVITQLGVACYKSSLNVEGTSVVYEELCHASRSLIVDSTVHLLYLCVTDESLMEVRPDWSVFLDMYHTFSPEVLRCAQSLGVTELLLVSKATGNGKVDTPKSEGILFKFYCALILHDLTNHVNIWTVAEKYKTTRGFVQSLLSNASSYCFHLTQFCKNMSELWALAELLQIIQQKLNFTFNQDLHALLEIPRVKFGRAKQLYDAGFRSLAAVANCDARDLIKHIEKISFVGAKQIIEGAKMVLNEKVDSLKDEVAELISVPDSILNMN